ncbi:MAG: hypothetical protein IJ702_08930, partial [Fretibacterium sp.]|nr:hypothetical protein [Fretibacterium sp.]
SIAFMLNQTMKPDKIILWLGEKEFSGKKLPRIFRKLLDYGVEVQFREDVGPHTKYFYAVQEYPEDIIITIDDDVLYGPALVESLYRSYQKHPDCVSASCIYKMKFDARGAVMKYDDWEQNYIDPMYLESHQYFALGVGGVLYPSQSLPQETFNLPALKQYSFHQDDIWLKFMEVINDTKVVFAPNKTSNHIISVSQATALWRTNCIGGNDEQLAIMIDAYNDWFGDGRKLTDIMAEG